MGCSGKIFGLGDPPVRCLQEPVNRQSGDVALLIDFTSHHLAALNTVIAAPLIESSLLQPDLVVLLPIEIAEQSYTLDLTVMGAVPAARLTSRVANLIQMEDVIRRGLDRIFTGF